MLATNSSDCIGSGLHGAHGADVETKQATSNDGDGCDEVDIAELFHHGGRFVLACRCLSLGVLWI
jgi:hypothetical protein